MRMFQIKWTFPAYILLEWRVITTSWAFLGNYPAFHNFGKLLKLYMMLLGPLHFSDLFSFLRWCLEIQHPINFYQV